MAACMQVEPVIPVINGRLASSSKQPAQLRLCVEPEWHKHTCLGDQVGSPSTWRRSAPQPHLVTFPALAHVEEIDLKLGRCCPSIWDHETAVIRVLLDCFQRATHSHSRAAWGTTLQLLAFVIFREQHPKDGQEVGPFHWYTALKAHRNCRFVSFKRALFVNHGVASHWSCTHTDYWSAVWYGCMPTPGKPQDDPDPSPFTWAREGPDRDLVEVCQEPTRPSLNVLAALRCSYSPTCSAWARS